MTSAEKQARGWTYERQRLGAAAVHAAGALRDVVGVYSSHPSAPLSLLARCPGLDPVGFRALDALRLPAMRGSIHLLPRDTAHLAFRAVPEAPRQRAGRLKYMGLSMRRYAEVRKAVLAAATEPRTANELREATGVGKEIRPVLGAMAREGLLGRVGASSLRSNAIRYVAAEVPEADAHTALAWLAGEYLRAFGPARAEDFAWWSGAPTGRARSALATVESEELEGGLLLPSADRPGFERAKPPKGSVDLLPKWDCYTMGYPSGARGRFAHPDVADRLYDFRGDGRPVVLASGAAVGTWGLKPGGKPEVELELFEKPGQRLSRALDERIAGVQALLA